MTTPYRDSRVVRLAMLAVIAQACASPERSTWQEEVRFSDGRIVRVEREITWHTTQPLGEGKSYITGTTVLRPLRDGTDFVFPEWRGDAEAILLFDVDSVSGSFALVTYAETCSRYNSGGQPNPPYFEYRVRADRWEAVPFEIALVGKAANMSLRPDVQHERPVVDLEYKAQSIPKYRPQARSLVAQGRRSNC
jgi:hypothetical protein